MIQIFTRFNFVVLILRIHTKYVQNVRKFVPDLRAKVTARKLIRFLTYAHTQISLDRFIRKSAFNERAFLVSWNVMQI